MNQAGRYRPSGNGTNGSSWLLALHGCNVWLPNFCRVLPNIMIAAPWGVGIVWCEWRQKYNERPIYLCTQSLWS